MIMKKLLFLFLLISPIGLNAQAFIVNGVYYVELSTDNVGVANPNISSFYKGDIIIPEIVKYNNKTYTVTSIENYAFTGSKGLTSVTLPKTITVIGDGSFSGCMGLTSFVIPENVTIIGYDAFYGSNNIKDIYIPKSVTTICSRAFSGLERLILEDGDQPLQLVTLYSINDNTPFHICPLKTVYLGRDLEYTSQYAPFRDNAKLEKLIIGKGATKIGSYLFDGCNSLTYIVSLNINPPSCDYPSAFSGVDKNNCLVWVPQGSLSAYREANVWNDFANICKIVEGDLNLDEQVDQDDLEALVGFIMGENPENFYKGLADLNGDGKIDAADVVIMVKLD